MKFLIPSGGYVEDCFGILTAPNHKGIVSGVVSGLPWAADLGCSDGPEYVKRLDVDKTDKWLEGMQPYHGSCLFVAGGDVVGDAQNTLELYYEFERKYSSWPLAYIAQDGSEDLQIPKNCQAVFIGGSTEWKESMSVVSIIKRAQAMGKHIHIGRVNSRRRYNLFKILKGSEGFTCDGTRIRFERDKFLQDCKNYQLQISFANM